MTLLKQPLPEIRYETNSGVYRHGLVSSRHVVLRATLGGNDGAQRRDGAGWLGPVFTRERRVEKDA